jgi:hypothetical protein
MKKIEFALPEFILLITHHRQQPQPNSLSFDCNHFRSQIDRVDGDVVMCAIDHNSLSADFNSP